MKFKNIKLEIVDGIAEILLNRPGRDNAINVGMVDDLREAFTRIEDDNLADRVVIRGAGANFCGGIDLRDFPAESDPDIHGFSRWEKALRILERLPAVTVASVHGECAGGGFQLILACDARVAADSAVFHLHETRIGFIPGLATFRLPRFIGLGRARRLALTGRGVEAAEALDIGLIDRLARAGSLGDETAAALAEFGDHIHPEAIKLTRRLMDESFECPWEDFLGRFLAAQHRAVLKGRFRDHVREAHDTDTPRGKIG